MNIRDIRELKNTAVQQVQSAPQAKKIVLIYAGITVALSALVTVISYCLDLQISQSGGLGNIGIRSILSTIQTILPIVQSGILMCLELGYLSATLRISRGQYASPNSLKMGVDRFWPLLRCTLLQGLIYIGIAILSIYIAVQIFLITPLSNTVMELASDYVGSVDATMMLDEATYLALYDAMLPLIPIFVLIFLVIFVPVFYRLRMASYILIDNPRYGALAILRESRKLMKHNCFRLFRLDLSLWWYYALSLLTTAIAYGDVLLPMLGVTLPWSDTVGYFLFYGIYLALQFVVFYCFQNRVSVTYALAYQSLLPDKPADNGVVLGNIFQM